MPPPTERSTPTHAPQVRMGRSPRQAMWRAGEQCLVNSEGLKSFTVGSLATAKLTKINHDETLGKFINTWKQNHTLVGNQWIEDEMTRRIR